MDFEMEYLKKAIKVNETHQKRLKKQNLVDQKLINIVETFIKKYELVCYGGIAINNILPKDVQFYDYHIDIPDYDFFSTNAIEHAKELAKIFVDAGYNNVEAKSAFFHGTYKVFVNFVPIADITQIGEDMFLNVKKHSIKREGIRYCDPIFLRMSMHQELSRPMGDTSRWEKIFQRLSLLNTYYPFETIKQKLNVPILETSANLEIYKGLKNLMIKNKIPLCGEYAMFLYSKHLSLKRLRNKLSDKKIYQLAVYVENVNDVVSLLRESELDVSVTKHSIGYKYMKDFYTVEKDEQVFMHIFLTNSCVSYNKVTYRNQNINVCSIDTILSLYFGLIITEHKTVNVENLYFYCFLLYTIINSKYNIEKDLLKRFNLPCIGKHETSEDIRKERNKKYEKLKFNKRSVEYDQWFLQYAPKPVIKPSDSKTKTRKTRMTKSKTVKNIKGDK
jgi:hypothetical protein